MLFPSAGFSVPAWSSQGFLTQGSGSSSNHANQVQPATAPAPLLPAASSLASCRNRFPDPVYEQYGPSPVRPFDFKTLFVKWLIDQGVADEYYERYKKHNYVPASEPDPYDFPAFLEYAEVESCIRDAEEYENYSRQLRQKPRPHSLRIPGDVRGTDLGKTDIRLNAFRVQWSLINTCLFILRLDQ